MNSNLSLLIIVFLLIFCLFYYVILRIKWKIKRKIKKDSPRNYLETLKNLKISEPNPNIIIIFTDDLGYEDISCFGAKTIKTPHIDKLAKQGIIFTNFYASSPVCSPSRAGLLTGRYPVRSHVPVVFFPRKSFFGRLGRFLSYSNGMRGIAQDEITIPEVLDKIGYNTGMVGKWHLGDKTPHLPNDKGFNFFYGALYSNDMKPYELYRDFSVEEKAPINQNLLTKKLTEECIHFIERNKNSPFFLYYAQPFPHVPLHVSEDFKNSSEAGIYGDVVQEIDWSVGEIIKKLNNLRILDNTLIIFTSDNGPWHEGNPGYARGRKGLTFDGGQRVPFIIYWNALATSLEVNAMAMNIDILPTLLDLLGVPIPQDRIIDGKSIKSLIEGKSKNSPHKELFYFWNKKIQAIRKGKWKYHIKHRSDNSNYFYMRAGPFLFNLVDDPNESYNQISHIPEIAEKFGLRIKEMNTHLKKNLRGWKK